MSAHLLIVQQRLNTAASCYKYVTITHWSSITIINNKFSKNDYSQHCHHHTGHILSPESEKSIIIIILIFHYCHSHGITSILTDIISSFMKLSLVKLHLPLLIRLMNNINIWECRLLSLITTGYNITSLIIKSSIMTKGSLDHWCH